MKLDVLKDKPLLFPIVWKYTVTQNSDDQLQFLLDCTVLPEMISLKQGQGSSVHESLLTRSYCFSLHKERLKLLGKWNYK